MESSPHRFEDHQAAAAWIARTFEPWAASLTADERQAIDAYKFDAYEPINEALRLGVDLDPENEQLVASLDSAIARFRIPEPVIVFRGFVDVAVREAAVGAEFVDFAYYSTSLIRSVAEGMIALESVEERAIGEILVPGGAQIGAFAAAPDLVRESGEAEILLPRESRFRISGRRAPDYLDLEVILR